MFTDSSINGHTMTATGTVRTQTASVKFGLSGLAITAGGRLAGPAHASFNLGTGDWTIEGWVKHSGTARVDLVLQNTTQATANNAAIVMNASASGDFGFYEQNTSKIAVASTGINDGSYHHFCAERFGNTVTLYVDGVVKGSYTTSFTFWNATTGPVFGGNSGGTNTLSGGSMDDLRITKGYARYRGAAFPVPSQQFPDN